MAIFPPPISIQASISENTAPAGGKPTPGVSSSQPLGSAHTAGMNPSELLPPASSSHADLRIDDHHQIYYELLQGGTGNVLFEIPPAVLRNIAESLKLPLNTEGGVPTLDVKS